MMAKRPDVRSYLWVGVGRERIVWRMGRRKARVLPEPVWARRKVSWCGEVRRWGIARDWICVGLEIWRERWRWADIVGLIPKEVKSLTSLMGESARVMFDDGLIVSLGSD